MKRNRSGRERLTAVFEGEMIDTVPFALKSWRLPPCTQERLLRDNGMAVLDSRPVHAVSSPGTRTIRTTEHLPGLNRTRTVVKTPRGDVTSVTVTNPGAPISESTTWTEEFPFKTEADYDAIEFMLADRVYRPSYEGYRRALDDVGEDAAVRTAIEGAPIHTLMYQVFGLDQFAVQLAENEERVMRLIAILEAKQRTLYEIVAQSPARIVLVGGNYAPEVLGKPRFDAFVVPHWKTVCDLLHEHGKLVGCHLDANNKLWAREVGDSALDWIESFSPAPSSDMTVAEARAMWPGKVLFLNFPAVVHLAEPVRIREATLQILREAAPGDRLVVGICETVPENRWRISFPVILETLNECGRLPLAV